MPLALLPDLIETDDGDCLEGKSGEIMRLLERRLAFKRTASAKNAADREPALCNGTAAESSAAALPSGTTGGALEIPAKIQDDQGAPQVAVAPALPRAKTSAPQLKHQKTSNAVVTSPSKLRRQLSAINSLAAIRLKMLLFGSLLGLLARQQQLAEAGFYTFYFPNLFKPKGYGELTDMINSLDAQLNATKDMFADTQYFWGQLQRLDSVESDYPEESACAEVFPLFRELAISYIYIDYDFYLKPIELYKEHLQEFRQKWYPAGAESKAALPREWEQKLMEKELDLKIEWLGKLTEQEEYKSMRERMLEIWKNVRRSLDTSLPCIYLRYAYRQIAEDINQVSLENNLTGMVEAMKVLVGAYKRIEKYKSSDEKIKGEIEAELEKVERFTIRS